MKTSLRLFGVMTLVLCASVTGAFAQGAAVSTPSAAQVALAAQKITVEAVRNKKTRITGGDFDDKTDQISFTVKLTNPDTRIALNDLKAEFYVLAQGMANRKSFELLGKDESTFSLPPRGNHSFVTGEVTTMWDNTGAIFGSKYDGWAILIRDGSGNLLLKKATSPTWMAVAEKLHTVRPKTFFDKDLKPVQVR